MAAASRGFNTWLGYDPDRRITVVVLANLNGNSADKLGAAMMTLARGGIDHAAQRTQGSETGAGPAQGL